MGKGERWISMVFKGFSVEFSKVLYWVSQRFFGEFSSGFKEWAIIEWF